MSAHLTSSPLRTTKLGGFVQNADMSGRRPSTTAPPAADAHCARGPPECVRDQIGKRRGAKLQPPHPETLRSSFGLSRHSLSDSPMPRPSGTRGATAIFAPTPSVLPAMAKHGGCAQCADTNGLPSLIAAVEESADALAVVGRGPVARTPNPNQGSRLPNAFQKWRLNGTPIAMRNSLRLWLQRRADDVFGGCVLSVLMSGRPRSSAERMDLGVGVAQPCKPLKNTVRQR
jgi:hypothetical protein